MAESYNKAFDLLHQLQGIIMLQQDEILKLSSRIEDLKEENEELIRERDELRRTNAEQRTKISELSRKSSLKPSASLCTPSSSSNELRLSLPCLPTSSQQQEDPAVESSLDFADVIPKVKVQEDLSTGVILRRPCSRGSFEERKAVYIPTSPESIGKKYVCIEEDKGKVAPQTISLVKSASNMSIWSTSSNEGSTTSIDTEADSRIHSGIVSPSFSITSSIGSTAETPLSPLATTEFNIASIKQGTLQKQHGFLEYPEEDDVDLPIRRPRVVTVGAAQFLANKQGKGSTNHPLKVPPETLHRRNSFHKRGHSLDISDQTYLSPDMEMKIQQMILQALGKKYGGLERANKAATVIQRAYRRYKINAQFRLIRNMQQSTRRERKMTMTGRHKRAPSILRKNKLTSSSNKMDEVRNKYITITQTGMSPSISRRELRGEKSKSSDQTQFLEIKQHSVSLLDVTGDEDGDLQSGGMHKSFSAEIGRSPSVFSGLSLEEVSKQELSRQQSSSAILRKRNIGTNIFNRKPLKGIQYLVYHGVLKDDPMDVAKFLKGHYGLSKEKIGEFVGEIRYEFNMAVLECLVQLIDLSNKSIDEALRCFQQLFRMPGEAQKIDKIMQVFAGEYYQSNKDAGIIKSEDASYILSFAIMMLHTDLHNPSVRRHMTKKDWLRMNKGTNDSSDFPEEFLIAIYERIQQKEFATGKDHTHDVMEIRKQITGSGCPHLLNPQRRFLGAFEVIQVNDMNKRTMRKHRRTLLLFNDVLLVVKTIAANKYEYRKFFSLLNSEAMIFNSNAYKHGVFIQHEANGEVYYWNCLSEEDKMKLVQLLNDAINELKEMEKERITDFGFTFKENESDNGSGDLLSSKNLSSSADDLHGLCKDNYRKTVDNSDTLKRTSKDSGFESPHTTSPLPIPNGPSLVVPSVASSNGAAAMSNGLGHINVSPYLNVSPSRKSSRPRTPENKRTLKVVPNDSYYTLRPNQLQPPAASKRKSAPIEVTPKPHYELRTSESFNKKKK